MNRLDVYINETHIGTLTIDAIEDQYRFHYTSVWQSSGYAVSPHLPLKGEIPSGSIKRFLENLLPEGKGLEALTHFHRISKNNIFALIQAIGFETAGALNFGNIDDSSVPLFRPISKMELEERIDTIEEQSIIIWDQKQRLSLAGVQEKLPVMIKNGEIGLADGALSSTHILKFQTQRYMHIVANEYFCMSLAKSIGLPVANVALQRFGVHPVLVVERFDRRLEDDTITRLHVIDGCQILDLPSSYKYERNFGSGRDVKEIREGVSFRKLFEAANKCQVPAKAKLQLLEWSIFNLIIGNSDAHGKNISFFVSHSGYSVAPHYDILSVLMHEGIDHELAMSFGDTFDPGEIKGYPLREFAEEIDLPPKLVSDRINRLCKKVLQALEKDTISDGFFNSHEKEFVQHLSNLMKRRAEELSLSAEEMLKVSW